MIPYLDSFLDMMVAERASSRHTMTAYARDLTQAHAFMAKRDSDLAAAKPADISAFLSSLKRLAARSRARKLSALKQYYRFLISENARKDDPTMETDAPKLPKNLPHPLSIEEMQALLAATIGDRPENLRMRALMELAYGSGLRVSELMSLPLAGFHEKRRAILVRGKGEKERLVPLSAPAMEAVSAYLPVRGAFLPKKKKTSLYLFPSHGKEGYLSRIRFYQMLKDLALRAGVNSNKVHPHNLRHAFATHLLAGGADLRSLQQMLGHADIGTTQIYTHVVSDHLTKAVETHHPLAKKGRRVQGGGE
jgi:integrase/recombinase XerD